MRAELDPVVGVADDERVAGVAAVRGQKKVTIAQRNRLRCLDSRMAEAFGGRVIEEDVSSAMLAAAESLARTKYGTREWTRRV